MMGWPPEALWRCTLAQFLAQLDGWLEMHTVQKEDETEAPTREELDALIARYG